jgi:hypothetical protein
MQLNLDTHHQNRSIHTIRHNLGPKPRNRGPARWQPGLAIGMRVGRVYESFSP